MTRIATLLAGMALLIAGSPIQAQSDTATEHMRSANPILFSVMIDQLEWRDNGGDPAILEADAWLGGDLNRLWLTVDAEYADGRLEEAEYQALYSRAVTPFWDLQVGLRHDARPGPERDWFTVGVHGLAPYFLETEARLYVGESGDTAMKLKAEYEALLTQRWILSPEIKASLNGQNNRLRGEGSGLSEVSAGLRLRYEIRREIAPYIGIHWKERYGTTAGYRREAGLGTSETSWVAGIRLWF